MPPQLLRWNQPSDYQANHLLEWKTMTEIGPLLSDDIEVFTMIATGHYNDRRASTDIAKFAPGFLRYKETRPLSDNFIFRFGGSNLNKTIKALHYEDAGAVVPGDMVWPPPTYRRTNRIIPDLMCFALDQVRDNIWRSEDGFKDVKSYFVAPRDGIHGVMVSRVDLIERDGNTEAFISTYYCGTAKVAYTDTSSFTFKPFEPTALTRSRFRD